MWSGGTTHCARDWGASCAKRCHSRSQTGCMATASHCSCTLTTVVWHHPNLAHYPIAEVASQFSEPGGMYLYARTAFGRFVGLQVGWFWLLAIIGGGAAGANLFLNYLAEFFPSVTHGW